MLEIRNITIPAFRRYAAARRYRYGDDVPPKLLLADEPTSALDVTTQAQIVRQMMELRDETGVPPFRTAVGKGGIPVFQGKVSD